MSKLQTVIFFIRHGQTDKDFSSDAGIDNERVLTEEGRAQEKRVGEYLKSFAPSVIYSSHMKRAVETAEIIKVAAEIPGDIISRSELAEMYHGQVQGYAERGAAFKDFLQELCQKHAGEQIVLSFHEDPIESMVAHLGFTTEELDFPCQMSQGYRLVFAGEVPVECQKINPAGI
ncbi:MAG TPA: histidine phosphatase family protein [Candidatus Saccharimonadales bacterium]|nr:histidine phosphatase family protein [Candidatus Saccharimonadales bacterium]